MPPRLDHLLYVDDSGHPSTGTAVYGYIAFRPDQWAATLGRWLEHRKMLWREFGVPVEQELHMTQYVRGRGRIANPRLIPDRHFNDGNVLWQNFGREIAEHNLDAIRSFEGIRIGSVYRRGAASQIHQTKSGLYQALIRRTETEMAASESLALVFMDGDGSDSTYRAAHRALHLRERHVIEDAILLDSKASQLIQIADHVAWCANAFTTQHPGNRYAHGWYERYLAERDPARTPQEL